MNCYNCKDRKPSCHSICETYKRNKEKTDLARKNKQEEVGFESYLYDARKTMQDRRGVMRL